MDSISHRRMIDQDPTRQGGSKMVTVWSPLWVALTTLTGPQGISLSSLQRLAASVFSVSAFLSPLFSGVG